MRALLVTHPACRRHRAGRHHPERPARLEAAVAGVRVAAVELVEAQAPPAGEELLELVHTPEYVETLRRFCQAGGGALDPDTAVVEESWEAALRAAGSGPEGVRRLRRGEAEAAFLAVRPPGHHALPSRAMGFCLFNNLAMTAALLREEGERVAVVDWDVHHGNGTQQVFYEDPEVLYLSLHQFPFYPGTGRLDEVGSGPGRGTTVNVPLSAGTGGAGYLEAFERVVEPVLGEFGPDWVLVSAGYDAHRADPLAGMELLAGDYRAMAQVVMAAAPSGRVIYFLEGGYDLEALEASVAATLEPGAREEQAGAPADRRAEEVVQRVVAELSHFWDLV